MRQLIDCNFEDFVSVRELYILAADVTSDPLTGLLPCRRAEIGVWVQI